MVVAAAGAQQFGSAESTLTARLPLMVRPSAPRFLNFGDRFELPVVVQNQTDAPMTSTSPSAANLDAELPPGGPRVTVPANDRVEVRFPAAAAEARARRASRSARRPARWADAARSRCRCGRPRPRRRSRPTARSTRGRSRQPCWPRATSSRSSAGSRSPRRRPALQALTDAVLYLAEYPLECAEQSRLARARHRGAARRARRLPGRGPAAARGLDAAVARDVTELDARCRTTTAGSRSGAAATVRGRTSPSTPPTRCSAPRRRASPCPTPRSLAASAYLTNIEQPHPAASTAEQARRTLAAYALHVRARQGDRDPGGRAALYDEAGSTKLPLEALGWLLPAVDDAGASEAIESAASATAPPRPPPPRTSDRDHDERAPT